MNANTTEIIESYLKGELSGAEKTAFEAQLEQDPLFKSEIELQKDIMNSIKGYRKNQLKERLNNIDVSATSYFNLAAIKIGISILILGMLSYGSYFYLSSEDEIKEEIKVTSGITQEKIASEVDIPQTPKEANDGNPESIKEQEVVKTESQIIKEETASKKSVASNTESKNAKVERKEVIVAPNVIDTFEEKQIIVNNSHFDNTSNSNTIPSDKITEVEIKHEENKSKDLKYKYLNKKLYLYGDFSTSPYELIELNSNVGKKLFLFHNNLYYQLSESQKTIAPLAPINDSIVIQELDSLKAKKGN